MKKSFLRSSPVGMQFSSHSSSPVQVSLGPHSVHLKYFSALVYSVSAPRRERALLQKRASSGARSSSSVKSQTRVTQRRRTYIKILLGLLFLACESHGICSKSVWKYFNLWIMKSCDSYPTSWWRLEQLKCVFYTSSETQQEDYNVKGIIFIQYFAVFFLEGCESTDVYINNRDKSHFSFSFPPLCVKSPCWPTLLFTRRRNGRSRSRKCK